MSRRSKQIDANQMPLDFKWGEQMQKLVEEARKMQAAFELPPTTIVDNDFEACNALATSVKQAIAEAGMSRAEVVDGINAYFGRTKEKVKAEPPECFGPLTENMLNNYLSKPIEYKLPAYMLYAIHRVTNSLTPAKMLVQAEGGAVVTSAEHKRLKYMRLQEYLEKAEILKAELSRGMRGVV